MLTKWTDPKVKSLSKGSGMKTKSTSLIWCWTLEVGVVMLNPVKLFRAMFVENEETKTENERLRDALKSISTNTCCEGCQEAALVAREALAVEKREKR